jgi:DNA excision repair protein ERCC-4
LCKYQSLSYLDGGQGSLQRANKRKKNTETSYSLEKELKEVDNFGFATGDLPNDMDHMDEEEEEEDSILNELSDGCFENEIALNGKHDCKIVFRVYDDYENPSALKQLNPAFVVMTVPNLVFIRQVELFQARNPSHSLCRIYFLLYEDSVEEQQYLTKIRREKEAFESLIKEKGVMSVWKEQDGRTDFEDLIRDYEEDIVVGDSRLKNLKDASDDDSEKQIVVVDVRELRSSLPSMLYQRDFVLEPCTIEVGDYVLSPKTCVERKSISDLISSLNSGRLYNQTQTMFSHYENVFLLIEFDPERAFSTQSLFNSADGSGTISDYIYSKLLLLLAHFPRLRFLWSAYPAMTCQYFGEIKRSEPQPDPEEAKKIGVSASDTGNCDFHVVPKDMLLSVDGIDFSNYMTLLEHVNSMQELCACSLEDLSMWLGAVPGKKVFEFLHHQ